MKELYSFEIFKKKIVEEKTDNEDGSSTIKKVEQDYPVRIFLKKPSRKDREEISFIYKAEFGKAIAKGLSTKETLRRSVLDGGGVVSKSDLERAETLLFEVNKAKNDLIQAQANDASTEEIQEKLNALLDELEAIQEIDRQIYSRTAEAYAEDKAIFWTVLYLTYWAENKESVFSGVSFESRLNNYYEMCDEEVIFSTELEIIGKAYKCFYAALMLNEEYQTKEYFDLLLSES